jgi:hypothetical protein
MSSASRLLFEGKSANQQPVVVNGTAMILGCDIYVGIMWSNFSGMANSACGE